MAEDAGGKRQQGMNKEVTVTTGESKQPHSSRRRRSSLPNEHARIFYCCATRSCSCERWPAAQMLYKRCHRATLIKAYICTVIDVLQFSSAACGIKAHTMYLRLH